MWRQHLPSPLTWNPKSSGYSPHAEVERRWLSSASGLFLSLGIVNSHLDWPRLLPALFHLHKPLTHLISNLTSTSCLIVFLCCFSMLEPHSWELPWNGASPFLGHCLPLLVSCLSSLEPEVHLTPHPGEEAPLPVSGPPPLSQWRSGEEQETGHRFLHVDSWAPNRS